MFLPLLSGLKTEKNECFLSSSSKRHFSVIVLFLYVPTYLRTYEHSLFLRADINRSIGNCLKETNLHTHTHTIRLCSVTRRRTNRWTSLSHTHTHAASTIRNCLCVYVSVIHCPDAQECYPPPPPFPLHKFQACFHS